MEKAEKRGYEDVEDEEREMNFEENLYFALKFKYD